MTMLQVIWFVLIFVLLTGYAILDGFDLGAGFWHLLARKDQDRRAVLNAIGPVWDGNEVWLLTAGGALFAAFPHVYATVFSGFYLALMLALFALIFRAVSIEFRSQHPSARWRSAWDVAFATGSVVAAVLFGVALGNILRGLPLDESKTFTGSFWDLLNPYAILIGLLGLVMLATHGALYLAIKTVGELAEQVRRWARQAWVLALALFAIASVVTIAGCPRLLTNYKATPALWALPTVAMGAIVLIGVFCRQGAMHKAFAASTAAIAAAMATAAVSLFPNLVPALYEPARSLTITNASSSERTLRVMLIIVLVGMPAVLAYTIWAYRVFRGTLSSTEGGY